MKPPERAIAVAGWDRGLALEDDLEGLDGLLRDKKIREAAAWLSGIKGRSAGLEGESAPEEEGARPSGGLPGDTARVRRLLRRTEEVLERSESLRQALLLELEQTRAQGRFRGPETLGPRGTWFSEQA